MNVRLDDQGRKVKEGEQVVVGGNERYKQSCARCFYSDL
jgi:thymidine kinase